MHITLERYAYTPTETQGRLTAGEFQCHTIEKPWVKAGVKGGMPFKSCIPDGAYEIIPYERASGAVVPALVNHALGVNLFLNDGEGRYAILIHPGNWQTDVVGCIAPGLGRAIGKNPKTDQYEQMVTSSKTAMRKLNEVMPFDETHTLLISNSMGAE